MWALFIPALVGALVSAVGSIVGRSLMALGVGFITYKGIDLALDAIKDKAVAGITGLPADISGLIGFLWVDKALSVVLSAIAAALALRAVSGSVKKMVLK